MVKGRQRPLLLALAALLGVWGLLRWTGGSAPAPAARVEPVAGPRTVAGNDAVARIDLERLGQARPEVPYGRRDVFAYGAPPAPDRVELPPPVAVAPPQLPPPEISVPVAPPRALAQPPARVDLKYVGALEGGGGLRVAVFLNDREEVLTGRPGDVVAHRFKIVEIGFESVDIQELGSERVQRIPFKGK